ncbi:hypothetical protein GGE65_007674 [Skermanella aerolata]
MAKTLPQQLDFGLIVTNPDAARQMAAKKLRRCLHCARDFDSAGPGNRICMRCRGLDAFTSPSVDFPIHAAF